MGARCYARGSYYEHGQGAQMTWNQSNGNGETDFWCNRGGGSGGFDFFIGTNGSYTKRFAILSNGDAQSLSDEREKHGFKALAQKEVYDFINNVETGYFNWNESGELDIGVYAQKVEKWAPLLVNKGVDRKQTRTMSYSKMSVYHHAALRYVLPEVEQLKDRVSKLEQQLGVRHA